MHQMGRYGQLPAWKRDSVTSTNIPGTICWPQFPHEPTRHASVKPPFGCVFEYGAPDKTLANTRPITMHNDFFQSSVVGFVSNFVLGISAGVGA
jgi:hypothetical protein